MKKLRLPTATFTIAIALAMTAMPVSQTQALQGEIQHTSMPTEVCQEAQKRTAQINPPPRAERLDEGENQPDSSLPSELAGMLGSLVPTAPPRRPKRSDGPRMGKLPGIIRLEEPVIGTLPYDGYVRGSVYHYPDTSRFPPYRFREGILRVWAEVDVEGWIQIPGTVRIVYLLPIGERAPTLGVGSYSMIVPRCEQQIRIVISDPAGTGSFARRDYPIEYPGEGGLYCLSLARRQRDNIAAVTEPHCTTAAVNLLCASSSVDLHRQIVQRKLVVRQELATRLPCQATPKSNEPVSTTCQIRTQTRV